MREIEVLCRSIGVIRSPFQDVEGMPIQPAGGLGILGTVEVWPEFAPGLEGLDGFSHIILLYQFHLAGPVSLRVTPFLDSHPQGVFATRAPVRPNRLGLSVVRLLGIAGATLRVENIDVVDGTPLLDIKPYVPQFDVHPADRIGWLEQTTKRLPDTKSDGRFR